jgi:hypothetical protein
MLAVVSVARIVANELTKYEWLTHVVVGAANGDPVPPERHPDSPTSSMPPKSTRTRGRLNILGDEILQSLFGTVRGHKLVTNDLGSPRTGHRVGPPQLAEGAAQLDAARRPWLRVFSTSMLVRWLPGRFTASGSRASRA